MPLNITILKSINEVSTAAWNAVVAGEEAPVVRWEWLAALENSGSAVPERGWEAHHFAAWRGSELVGVAPAWRKFHSMGEFVYDFGWANAAQSMGLEYYPKLLVGLPLSPVTATRFLVKPGISEPHAIRHAMLSAAVKAARDDGLSSVHVLFPPEHEAQELEQAGLFRRSTMQYHWRNPGYRTYDDFLARFDSKRRNQLKRERAAAAKQGLTLRTIRSHELTPRHAELAFRFYHSTASRHAWGPIQLTRGFFEHVFANMPDRVELVVAEQANGTVVAGAFNLHSAHRLYGRYWGCFTEFPFLHFNVCLYHSIDDCIQRGLKVFEPGAGGEHKISRGFEPTTIHSAHLVFNATLSAAIQAACRRERAEVASVTHDSEAISGMKPWPGATL